MPEASVSGSPETFLYALLLGVCLGVVYDVFRIARIGRTGATSGAGKRTKRLQRVKLRRVPHGLPARHTNPKRTPMTVRAERCIVFFEDILFGLIAAVAVLLFLFAANSGVVRWYLLAGCGIGFICYYQSVGRIVIALSALILALLRAILIVLYNVTFYYFVLLLTNGLYALRGLLTRVVRLFRRRIMRSVQKRFTKKTAVRIQRRIERVSF